MRKTGWTAKFHQCMIAKIMDIIIIMIKRKPNKKKKNQKQDYDDQSNSQTSLNKINFDEY